MNPNKFKYFATLLLGILLISNGLFAQTYCTKEDQALCEKHLAKLRNHDFDSQSMNEVAVTAGKQFLGIPYVAKTLELKGDEKLVVNLSGLDCTTFLENVVVLSRLAKKQQLSFEAFQKELEYVRYRDGKQGDYPTRLHYFTDWIHENQQKGIIKDITAEIGGKPYVKTLNFMSTNRDSYQQLADDGFVKEIQLVENELGKRSYHYIPKADIQRLESGIQSGDLIAITTSIKGLDIVHVGFAFRKNGRIHLFHASTSSNEVEISEKPLSDYIATKKIQSGIMVCRLENI